ncbi:aminoglycoside phosphotransferase family protein [Cellulomonas sp. NS3]|uniref:aminoglycoside phosphotransferase family protein n=1 Tax=Cellulomonas sp. NS3 TaxID=2973977 RepID=UPI0021626874|nr:aminoglycoside phosphotransferase family protein [Cellulomonas sp. NS3]
MTPDTGAGVRTRTSAEQDDDGPTVPLPDRRLVDVDVVRRLVARQLPQWADLPVRPVETGGWDNQTFRLGDRMTVRLPTAAEYARAVEKEHRWLPVLAPQLPLPVPVPLALGRPGEGFRFPWSVYGWIEGERAGRDTVQDLTTFAEDLAGFLVALRGVDAADGPAPGLHSWFRGGPLLTYDEQTRDMIEVLGDLVPGDLATQVWETALRATWDGPPVWFHGDVAVGNLLVRDGVLSAVIDFGTCGVGDPACDLAIAWTLFSGESRDVYRERLGVDPGTWARGRGWALWKALLVYAGELGTDAAAAAVTRAVIDEILDEVTASG